MAEVLFNGRRLDELKVVEIRDELGKRGLPRKGIKSALIKRFEKVLLKERMEEESPSAFDEATEGLKEEDSSSYLLDSSKQEESSTQESLSQKDIQQDLPQDDDIEEDEEEMEANKIEVSCEEADGGLESSFVESVTEQDKQVRDERQVDRLESVTSIIEPTFPKEEELIYEGDVDNDEMEDAAINQIDMDVEEEEEEKDELIVDFTAGELDLDPKPSDEKMGASKQSNDTIESKVDTNKLDSGESSEERCNVWVSGLSQLVSASDLKTLFSPFGQVISAKVVARAKSSKNQRYGFVTMASPDQAEKSIQSLNNTELKGQMISVELTRNSPFVGKAKKEGLGNTPPTKDSSSANASKTTPTNSKGSDSKSKANNKEVGSKGSNSAEKTTAGKRIIAVEKTDGRKELYTTSGKRRRDEMRGSDIKRNRSRSPIPRKRSPRMRSKSPRPRSRSPRGRRRSSPRGRIVSHRLSPVRRVSGAPLPRRGISPPLHRRPLSPPLHRRMPSPPPIHRRVPSPPLRRSGGGDDVRRDLMRREMERREMERRDIRNRLGGRIAPPPPPPPSAPPPNAVHEIEMRLEEQRRRMINDREREREAMRREMEMEHARKEQELLRQMQEIQQREERDRSLIERQQREFIQLQRTIKERESHIEAKEREIREKEMRERQRLEALEKQKERDMREKEKKYRDQLERDMKERQLQLQKEQEAWRMKIKEQERMLIDKERQVRAEQEQLARAKEEAERKQRRKEEDEKERDRKDRRGHIKEDKDDKERIPKRTTGLSDEGIFGRLGNRDGHQPQDSGTAIVKETQISPNLLYRRIESKQGASRPVSNPYSQNQSRSKALDSLSANYATPRHSNNPVGYPQPTRYSSSSSQYAHGNSQSVGYGASNTSNTSNLSQFNSTIQNSRLTNLLNNPDLLNALTNAARTTLPSSGSSYGSSMSGFGGSSVPGGSSGSSASQDARFYGGQTSGMSGGQGRPGYPSQSGVSMGMSQSQFTKHMNKLPPEPDRYARRAPPRPDPYSHFNKRM